MPFLALDAGNSSVKVAVWEGAWSESVRFPLDEATVDVWADRLASVAASATRAGIASVRPSKTPVLVEAAQAVTGSAVCIVTSTMPLPFRLAYRTPATLGTDRLAAAVAAHAHAEGRAVIALDAGSAITTEVVTDEPAYLGGAILPGPDLLRRSLARDTDQLPDVPWPDTLSPVGASTVGAIQAGLGVLVADGVAGLLRRTLDTLPGDALVLATGGWGPWLAERIPEIDRVEPHLVLSGIRLLAAQVDIDE